jgi:hypothetical protein
MRCGGRGSVGRALDSQGGFSRERTPARQTNGAEADGKTVWSWHPLLVLNWRRRVGPTGRRRSFNPPMTVTRRIRRRGERGISRNTIVRGMPGCSDCTCMLVCAFYVHFCTRDRGCSKHPAFPAPSFFVGETICKARANAPRECGGVFCRHVWTAPSRQGLFWCFGERIGERSCIRPRDAASDRGP